MADPLQHALDMIQHQIKEVDDLYQEATKVLNVVAVKERVGKWKIKTAGLIGLHLGKEEGERFAAKEPGPAFSQDLVEELGDEVEVYRDYLRDLADRVKKARGNAPGAS